MNVQRIFRRILGWSAALAVVVALVCGVIGYLVAGMPGLPGALVGTVMAVVFGALTAASILLALKVTGGSMASGAFMGIVLGGWLVKFALFLAGIFFLKDAGWVNPTMTFVSIVAATVGSLVVDLLAFARARMTVVELDAPEEGTLGKPVSGDRSDR